MSTDFGSELDAALNGHVAALRAAADEARARIERGTQSLAAAVAPRAPVEPSPMTFDTPSRRSGAAVAFDVSDDEIAPVDDEGIPFPE